MSLQDKTGTKIPKVIFKIRVDHEWVERSTEDYFAGKKVGG